MTDATDPGLLDAARHMCDCVNLHVMARLESGADRPQFIAVKLDDGKSPDNNTLYDQRQDVFRHNSARNVMAVKIGVETMPLREAIIVLQQNRLAYSRGVIFSEEEQVTPQLTELLRPFIPNTLRKLN